MESFASYSGIKAKRLDLDQFSSRSAFKRFPHSVAFAYVADVTDESSRSLGYGLVTAGFAASLIISPALGAGIELLTGETIFSLGSDRLMQLLTAVMVTEIQMISMVAAFSLEAGGKTGCRQ